MLDTGALLASVPINMADHQTVEKRVLRNAESGGNRGACQSHLIIGPLPDACSFGWLLPNGY